MATPVAQNLVPRTYAELRQAVETVVLKGRQEIEHAWVQTYHETGRLINEHVLRNQGRANYGAAVFERLSGDTGISSRTLRECVQFQRCFPNLRTCAQLGWAHCRVLCQLEDEKQRMVLLREAVKKNWTVAQLTERIRPLNAALEMAEAGNPPASPASPLLTPKQGTPGVSRIVAAADGSLVVDLGFSTYVDLAESDGFKAGDFVQPKGAGWVKPEGMTKADLFTFRAGVLKIVDGDTLWVKIYLRPGQWVKQKLRLRDLDCPEIDTPEGRAAKRFAEAALVGADSVIITTSKPDKYDRYLSDVFIRTGAGEEKFLNNALLSAGHARIKGSYAPEDWET